jgi:hypothetical protein
MIWRPRALIVTGICLLAGVCLLVACSRKNNLLMGRVEATVGTHTVVVTDCYRTHAPEPQRLSDDGGQPVWRYMPCRDADVWIRGQQLTVNGKEYGRLNPADGVLVDHGVVSIEHRGADVQPPPRRGAGIRSVVPATFANRRILRLKRSRPWRSASSRIKRCERWCTRVISSLTPAG